MYCKLMLINHFYKVLEFSINRIHLYFLSSQQNVKEIKKKKTNSCDLLVYHTHEKKSKNLEYILTYYNSQ